MVTILVITWITNTVEGQYLCMNFVTNAEVGRQSNDLIISNS